MNSNPQRIFAFFKFISLIILCYFPPIFASSHSYKTVQLSNLEVQVEDAKSGKFFGKFDIKNGEKFPKILRLEKQIAVKIEFKIVDEKEGKLIEGIQQAFLRLWHSKRTEHEVFFIAKKNREERGKYLLKIDMQKDQTRFKAKPGRYNCELIIGDRRIKKGIRWHFIDAFVDVPKAKTQEPRSYEPRNRFPKFEMQSEIEHIFKPIETCNFKFNPIFYIFAVICVLPLIFLIKLWFPMFGQCFPAIFSLTSLFPWAQFFLGILSTIFAIYTVNWVQGKSITITLQFLPFIGFLCFLVGHFTLKIVAKERIELETEEEEEINEKDDGEEFEMNSISEETEYEDARNPFELEDIIEEDAEEIIGDSDEF